MDEKEIPRTEKRVDESWKEQISHEKVEPSQTIPTPPLSFFDFVTSLGIQALIRMGEVKTSETEEAKVDLEAAQETIDLLLMLKEKTKGNLSSEEERLLNSLVADLQLRFVQHKVV